MSEQSSGSQSNANKDPFIYDKKKPETTEYLKRSLDDVLARLNQNPNSCQSEEAVIQGVITIRNAKASERLTLAIALATFLLVLVPFFVPALDKKELQSDIAEKDKSNKLALSKLSANNESLQNELVKLKGEVESLKSELAVVKTEYNKSRIAKP